jgi:hypothetical protein
MTQRWDSIWRAKWTADGAKSVAEIASKLRAEADHLDEMAKAGVELQTEVADDYAFLETADPSVAERFGFQLTEPDEEDEAEASATV